MNTTPTANPNRATDETHQCSWCHVELATVPELLDHVVDTHLDNDVQAA